MEAENKESNLLVKKIGFLIVGLIVALYVIGLQHPWLKYASMFGTKDINLVFRASFNMLFYKKDILSHIILLVVLIISFYIPLIIQYFIDLKNNFSINSSNNEIDVVEQIRKMNDLLKEGIITQEEFDKKKSDLLSK